MEKERRKHPRAKCDLKTRIQWTSRCFVGVIKNVSDNGLFVSCEHRLLPGECVSITVEPPDCGAMVFNAEVVWSRTLKQKENLGFYGLGFRFLDVCLTQSESSMT